MRTAIEMPLIVLIVFSFMVGESLDCETVFFCNDSGNLVDYCENADEGCDEKFVISKVQGYGPSGSEEYRHVLSG